MTLTLHLIMSLHYHEREPIKPAYCACKHDLCPFIYDLNNTSWTQLLSATRYVKKFFELLNPPRHGLHGRLKKDEKVCLQTSPKLHHPRTVHPSFFKSPRSVLARNRNLYSKSSQNNLLFVSMRRSLNNI